MRTSTEKLKKKNKKDQWAYKYTQDINLSKSSQHSAVVAIIWYAIKWQKGQLHEAQRWTDFTASFFTLCSHVCTCQFFQFQYSVNSLSCFYPCRMRESQREYCLLSLLASSKAFQNETVTWNIFFKHAITWIVNILIIQLRIEWLLLVFSNMRRKTCGQCVAGQCLSEVHAGSDNPYLHFYIVTNCAILWVILFVSRCSFFVLLILLVFCLHSFCIAISFV